MSVSIDIEINDFLRNCDSFDIKELIKALVGDGWITQQAVESESQPRSIDEQTFEGALNKLRGKWNMLSLEEESQIIKIANRLP